MKRRQRSRPNEERMSRINRLLPKYLKGAVAACTIGAALVLCGSFYFYEGDAHPMSPSRLLLAETKHCKGDTVLPIFPSEQDWAVTVRAIIYVIFLMYLFLGTAIAADVFMVSIETITAKTKPIIVNGAEVHVEVWNATVANLTLMALGSSAPEIMLAIIEAAALKFEPGELGAGTIVGSAAFNLFVIIAICVLSLEEDEEDDTKYEVRRIEEFGVFGITAVSSLWAYLSLVVFLKWSTEDVVEIWEAFFTILSFPVLVIISWAQDNAWWGKCPCLSGGAEVAPSLHVTHVVDAEGHEYGTGTHGHHERRKSHTATETETKEEAVEPVEETSEQVAEVKKKRSRLEYRIQATRKMTGGKRVMAPVKGKKDSGEEGASSVCALGFEETEYAVMENCGAVTIKVMRTGPADKSCSVQFDTSDCDAMAGMEYVQTSGTINFAPKETSHEISIKIIDDDEWAPDKKFFVRLYNAAFEGQPPSEGAPELSKPTTTIIILNDDDPGKFSFDSRCVSFSTSDAVAKINILRTDGCSGTALAFLKTLEGTAVAGTDFEALPEDHEVLFEHEVRELACEIPLKQSGNPNVTFQVELTSVMPEGASVGDISQCTVVITDDKNYAAMVGEVMSIMEEDYKIGSSSWMEQIKDAMNMEVDEDCEPECSDYVIHAISFYWKVIAAFLPPSDYCGGWATFVSSMLFIGVITALVSDTAKIFGCLIGLEDAITAITFVALGTSLPDTFASVEATQSDDTADNACGNVTGSNSVNVFLGLGLPWAIGTIYHEANGTKYIFPAGDLSFSVGVFCALAVSAIGLLYLRRQTCGGELGGPKTKAKISAGLLVSFWMIYVVISSLKTKKHI